jgi:hydrogenase/urease accessory protein HupE
MILSVVILALARIPFRILKRRRRTPAGAGVTAVVVALLLAAPGTAQEPMNPALQPDGVYEAGQIVERRPGGLPSLGVMFRQEFPAGINHIVTGPDHIAFVVALALVAQTAWGLFVVVSFFTLAHALTLTLASLNVLPLGELGVSVIELGVALSIVWVAAENIVWKGKTHHRPLLAFGFGLVHGYAFSEHFREALLDVDLSAAANLLKFLFKVLAFNLGVDAGQLAVVYVTFGLLVWLRRRASPEAMDRTVLKLSAAIGLFGLVWSGERLWGIAKSLAG